MTSREIFALIRTTPDARGKCDTCQGFDLDLFEAALPNHGGFAYCRERWRPRARLKAETASPRYISCTTGTMAGPIPGTLANGERCDDCERFQNDDDAQAAIKANEA